MLPGTRGLKDAGNTRVNSGFGGSLLQKCLFEIYMWVFEVKNLEIGCLKWVFEVGSVSEKLGL